MKIARPTINKIEKTHFKNSRKEKVDKGFLNTTVQKILSSLRVSRRTTKRPMILAMIGLAGSGKSTTAKALAKPLGATILRNDELRARFLRPFQKEYRTYTEPILRFSMEYIFQNGGNVILDLDDVEGQTSKIFKDLVERYRVRVVHVRVVADRDVMMRRLIRGTYDPKNNIVTDSIVALRGMWRRTLFHYDWVPEPWPEFFLKKKLPIKPIATIDTTDRKKWKREMKSLGKRIKKLYKI